MFAQTNPSPAKFVVNNQVLKTFRVKEFWADSGDGNRTIQHWTESPVGFKAAAIVRNVAAINIVSLRTDGGKSQFQQLARQWREECATTSSPIEMAECPSYQAIIAMGTPALPLILGQLESEGDDPDHWFWALNKIAGADPVPPEDRGNLKKMRAAWIRWGRDNKIAW